MDPEQTLQKIPVGPEVVKVSGTKSLELPSRRTSPTSWILAEIKLAPQNVPQRFGMKAEGWAS